MPMRSSHGVLAVVVTLRACKFPPRGSERNRAAASRDSGSVTPYATAISTFAESWRRDGARPAVSYLQDRGSPVPPKKDVPMLSLALSGARTARRLLLLVPVT